MRVGKTLHKARQSKSPTLNPPVPPLALIANSLRAYSHENLAWLRSIDKLLQKPRSILAEIHCNDSCEWMQRYFRSGESVKQIVELIQYYKYYKTSPLLVHQYHFAFMNAYWTRSKTIYYLRIKKILQIEQEGPEETLERNIQQEEQSRTEDNKSTFYLMPYLNTHQATPANEHNSTLEKIISSLQKKGTTTKAKTITDIDKAFKLSQKDQSKTKDRHSQQKSHLKSNPSNFVSHFSYKTNVTKKKKNNHKSLSSEPVHSQEKVSKGKKLITTNSCMNIAYHESNLNYQRREKNLKQSQKQAKPKKREGSQINLHEPKSSHKKAKSNERSSQAIHKSKSGKKRMDTQSNVRAAIDKTKHKIKLQKSQMLKKYIQSRQSYTKSIDSTCGDVAKHPRK